MKKIERRILGGSLLLALAFGGAALAGAESAHSGPSVSAEGKFSISGSPSGVRPATTSPIHREGSTSDEWREASSTRPGSTQPPIVRSSTTPPLHSPQPMSVTGKVTEVNSLSLVMTSPIRAHGTPTLRVNLSPSTIYRKGTTTASLSDIKVGSEISVYGRLSTTTKTINAARITIGIGAPGKISGDDRRMASTTQGEGKGVMEGIKHFFGNIFAPGPHERFSTSTQSANASDSLGANSRGFFSSLFHGLFGWMDKGNGN